MIFQQLGREILSDWVEGWTKEFAQQNKGNVSEFRHVVTHAQNLGILLDLDPPHGPYKTTAFKNMKISPLWFWWYPPVN